MNKKVYGGGRERHKEVENKSKLEEEEGRKKNELRNY